MMNLSKENQELSEKAFLIIPKPTNFNNRRSQLYRSSNGIIENNIISRNTSEKFHNTSGPVTPFTKQELNNSSCYFTEESKTNRYNYKKNLALPPKNDVVKNQIKKELSRPIQIKPLQKLQPKALSITNESLMESVTEPSESLNIEKHKLEEVHINIDLYDNGKASKHTSNSVSKKRSSKSKVSQKFEISRNKHIKERKAVSIHNHP